MHGLFRSFVSALYEKSVHVNEQNIIEFARRATRKARDGELQMCDLGCGLGALTRRIADAASIAFVDVVETFPPHVEEARTQGFSVIEADLNGQLPIEANTYDVVISNQVIEHLYDTDTFLSEALRITRPGGTFILSTENAASWCNVGALILGWQPFSLTNVTTKAGGIGNPFALHGGETGLPFPMQHHRLFTVKAVTELLRLHGGVNVECKGAGYYPLPSGLGRVDPVHAHFICFSVEKKAARDLCQNAACVVA